MLTIGQLAAYAGVTARAVRHYHQIGLLPEPERDASGYRRYGATAVVSLIKIRILASAGVPLSQIGKLLQADGPAFATRSSGWRPAVSRSRSSGRATAWCSHRRWSRISTGSGSSGCRSAYWRVSGTGGS